MYERQTQTVTARIENWQRFLLSASRNYKLPFDEQILIHAQRPDATAVLEIEKWNAYFGRWVNRGATGIAVVDKSVPGRMRLKYYFDVADTHGSRFERPIRLWDMKPEYEPEVIETLEATFGELENADTLADAILSAASNAVADNITDYLTDLQNYRDDSFLEDLDELNVEVFYKRALTASISFMLLSRCGIDPNEYLTREDFEVILNFNTPQTAGLLGTATSDIAEMGLREIARTVLSLEKSARAQNRTFAEPTDNRDNNRINQNEGGLENGSIDIQRSERVSDTRPDRAGGAGNRAWKVRPHAPQLSSEPPQGSVHGAVDERQAEQSSDGNRADGGGAARTPERADGESRGRDGRTESLRPDGVDTADDEHPQPRGGNDTERTDLQLSFPTEEEQRQKIEEAGVTGLETPPIPAFSLPIPIEELDRELKRGSGVYQGKFRIYQHYQDLGAEDEHVKFLRKEYGSSSHSALGFGEYGVSNESKGMTFKHKNAALMDGGHTISWAKVSKRIEQLIAADRYLSERDKTEFYPQFLEYQEQQRILRGKEAFINEMASVPNAEKRDSLSLRLSDFINGLGRYEKVYLGKHELEDYADAVSIEQIDALLLDPRQTALMMDALIAIKGATTDSYVRNNAWRFGEELKDICPREYAYHLGDAVYIGNHEYKILSFDEQRVTLYDTEFPLMNAEFERADFDKKVAENPLNEHLLQAVVDPTEKSVGNLRLVQVGGFFEAYDNDARIIAEIFGFSVLNRDGQEFIGFPSSQLDKNLDTLINTRHYVVDIELEDLREEAEPYTPKVGDRYEIQGRQFVVDSVNPDFETVSLLDATFQNGVGFPIFRKESFDFIRMYDPVREQQPGVEEWSEAAAEEPNTAEAAIAPAWEQKKKPQRVNYFDAFPDTPMSERNNFRIKDDRLGEGGAKAKFRMNMAAIELLHELELDRRLANPGEQEILSRYVGWGSLSQAFDENNGAWADERFQLQTALSDEEYDSARATTLNAHYTSPTVIKAMYKAIENMGFRTGNILDPGCGVGNFQGLLPESMSGSKVYGIEIDPITGRIAQQLYQKNSIAIQGFERTALPDSFFDLAIGNVPFGNYGVSDKRYDKYKFHIHDYFFAKTLDKVRPGGVVAFVTSSWTMDKQNPTVRKYLAQQAELLGAIRLPNNAFLANAGTQVTTDILFLQKRDRLIDIEPDWVHLSHTENGIPVNAYFAERPEMVLGTMSNEDGTRMYGNQNSTTCIPFPDRDLADLLDEAIQNIHGEIADYERDEDEQEQEDDSIPADPNVRNFSFTVVDGKVYFRENSRMTAPELSDTAKNRIMGLIRIRDCVRDLIEFQTEDYGDNAIRQKQAELNRLYDGFVKKYGLISSRANTSVFGTDSSFPLLGALEILDEDGNLLRKADMFTKRTIRPHIPITHVDTASEALAVSLAEKARVDLAFMSELSGMSEDALIAELNGVIFLNIDAAMTQENTYVTADEYLSGNVREKLAMAKAVQSTFPDGRYDSNVRALEAVQPQDLTAAEISVRLGATWLPVDVVQEFVFDLLNPPYWARSNIKVHYSKHTGEWVVEGKSSDRGNVTAYATYGTGRANAYKIIEESLNLRDVRIFDYEEDADGRKHAILNKKETTIAQSKQEQIKVAFADWIWKDPERRQQLCRIYNDRFNSVRPREYDGSHIRFVGMNPAIALKPHQINAVAHIMYGGNTLLAHEVGSGKTFEMVAAAMEMKRIGLCHKSMIVVPNHIIEQFAAEWMQLYPSSNILVSTKKDFEMRNRRKFFGRIATGDYDAVIIGHSQFEKIPMSLERQRHTIENQIHELLEGIHEAKRSRGDNFTVKQLEKSRKSLQLKLDKLNDQSRKDDIMTFEELGVDRLFVDEAHSFKNLFLYTKMRNVGGIAQTEAQKSSDMFMKCQYLDSITDGKGVIFATGTPISNSMVELYTMQRYLQYPLLQRNELTHFDSWASTFGETVTAIELSPEGSGYRAKTRFAKFYNIPELMNMFREVADIQTADMLELPVPKANFHNIVIPPSDLQKEMVASLAERAEKVRNREVNSTVDNMLCITNDGRKLALDQRLMNPLLPDNGQSKTTIAAENIFRHWEDGRADRLSQLVFCDLSTPKKVKAADGAEVDGEEPGYTFSNVYSDIRQKLTDKGVPENEIAFIHDADTEVRKKELFAKVRQGKVRVLLGSTFKMGAGTNCQDRLIALHHLDVPWRPSDLEQREGRIIRQGNKNPEVEVYRYVTEQTFDAYSYQLIENKQKFISQIMTSKSPVRSAEDVDEQALSYAEVKALATGNPLIIEKCDLEMQVGKLKLLKSSYLSQRYSLEDKTLKQYPADIKRLTELVKGYEHDIEWVKQQPQPQKDVFIGMVVEGIAHSERKAAGTAILEACKAKTTPDPTPLGEYRGFQMELSFDSFNKAYEITLKGALSHKVALGTDIGGNITRLDNILAGLPEKLDACRQQLEAAQSQLVAAKAEIEKPFPQETELAEKSQRLAEVNIALNLDKREIEVVDAEPDEGDAAPDRKEKAYAR
jgi:N12 class adenine-specific DNA methylase